MSIHDIEEYQLAKDICKELPQLRQLLITTQNSLEKYMHYMEAAMIHKQVAESLIIIDVYLDKYEKVLDTKGKKG